MKILNSSAGTHELSDSVADWLQARGLIMPRYELQDEDGGPVMVAQDDYEIADSGLAGLVEVILNAGDDLPDYEPKPAFACTFAFWRDSVVLVKKSHPDWQAGRYNGIGGRLEPGEPPRMAATREFYEETGIKGAEPHELNQLCILEDEKVIVHFYWFELPHDMDLFMLLPGTNDIGESLYICPADSTDQGPLVWQSAEYAIDNLSWLIPMARDKFHIAGLVAAKRRVLVDGEWIAA